MPRKGLTKESVIDAAVQMIEEGYPAFSMNELARQLEIKPASLYNHVQSMDELVSAVGLRTAEMLKQAELAAIKGKERDDALFALCNTYRTFAWDHQNLYKVMMGMQRNKSACTVEVGGEIIEPMLQALSGFALDEVARTHWQRILRSLMHGFVAQEYTGRFTHSPIDRNETYHMAIKAMIQGIQSMEKEVHNP